MGKAILTDESKQYIRDNYLKMSSRHLSEKIGCSRTPILIFLKSQGLSVPADIVEKWRVYALKGRSIMTADQDMLLKKHLLEIPVKRLARKIGVSDTCLRIRIKQLKLKIPIELIEQRKQDSRLKKGHVAWNKGQPMSVKTRKKVSRTWFKKGSLPHNYNGGEHISKDGYIVLSMGEGKVRLKHIHLWEQKNRPLPAGHCLRCVDGNIQNTDPSKWQLITRAKNMELNTIHRYPPEMKKAMKKLSKLSKLIKTKEHEQINP